LLDKVVFEKDDQIIQCKIEDPETTLLKKSFDRIEKENESLKRSNDEMKKKIDDYLET